MQRDLIAEAGTKVLKAIGWRRECAHVQYFLNLKTNELTFCEVNSRYASEDEFYVARQMNTSYYVLACYVN